MKKLLFPTMWFGLLLMATGSAAAQTNVALNKLATQSSTAYNMPASKAVDGNTNSTYGGNDITHTKDEKGAWWQVDLGNVYDIDKIEIWNRADCCWDRLSNFYVMVSEASITSNSKAEGTTTGPHFFTKHTDDHPTMILDKVRTGRYVRIFLDNGTNPLNLGEVQVFGKLAPCMPKNNQIAVFQHNDFSMSFDGKCKILDVGEYANPQLMDFKDDAISSIKVGKNVKAILFEFWDFKGNNQTFESDMDWFRGPQIKGDMVSSIKVICKVKNCKD